MVMHLHAVTMVTSFLHPEFYLIVSDPHVSYTSSRFKRSGRTFFSQSAGEREKREIKERRRRWRTGEEKGVRGRRRLCRKSFHRAEGRESAEAEVVHPRFPPSLSSLL